MMNNALVDILSNPNFPRKTKVLLLVAYKNEVKTVSKINELGVANGLHEIDSWNISMILKGLKGHVVKVKNGWTITTLGKEFLSSEIPTAESPIKSHHQALIQLVNTIKTPYIREFVEEAVNSLEYKLLKSAVVFSWIGAVSILYNYVVNNTLKEFNKEGLRRNSKWKEIKNINGFSRIDESEFLQIIESIGLIGKNTKQELENCLQLRNSCGHPSTLKIGENRVASHLEILVLNVYQKYEL